MVKPIAIVSPEVSMSLGQLLACKKSGSEVI